MLRQNLASISEFIKSKFDLLKKNLQKVSYNFSDVSFNIIILGLAVIICLYYPLGALLTDKINRDTEIEITGEQDGRSQTVEMISHLINQEVNEKIWTPNLPIFFPAAILDNMPNYQLGIINGISKFTTAFEKRLDSKIQDKENNSNLYRATTLLRYPGTVWMFDPHNKIKPVPSASSQYRKARRFLNKYNQSLIARQNTFHKQPQDLAYILIKSNINLSQSSNHLSAAIRENSSNFIDFKADDVFYYNQGKIYAYYLLIKALGYDYKDLIVSRNLYQNWISLTKALEEACHIQPTIVHNGELNSSFIPNHLAYLNAYILKAQNIITKITATLTLPTTKDLK